MQRSIFSFFLFTAFLPLYAQDGNSRLDQIENKLDQISFESVYGSTGPSMPSAIANRDGYGLYIFGDYLHWRSYITGIFSLKECRESTRVFMSGIGSISTLSLNINDVNIFNDSKFDFDSGYRLGIGYASAKYDNWDLRLEYTKFDNTLSDCFCCPCPMQPSCTVECPQSEEGNLNFLQAGEGTVSYERCRVLKLDNVDLTLGSNFFVFEHLSLRPHFGGKASWIDQDDQIEQSDSLTASSFFCIDGNIEPSTSGTDDRVFCLNRGKNDFWGVGPLVGLTSQWFLGKWINLYALAQGSMLFGKFEVESYINDRTTFRVFSPENELEIENTVCLSGCDHFDDFSIVPFFRAGVGLSGYYGFRDGTFTTEIHIGYEAQYYFRGNYLGSYSSIEQRANSPGDVSFHGLVVGATLGF